MRRFARDFTLNSETRILDVGGTPSNWSLLLVQPRITFLNLLRARETIDDGFTWVAADGRALPFRDHAFDIVFSNSVIEHVGDFQSQRKFAAEVVRVGVRCYVQTPNRWFPVETHLLTPLVHFLPRRWQYFVVPRCNVWSHLSGVDGERKQYYLQHYLNDIRLLDARGMRELFPAALLVRERFLGFTKSLIAMIR